MPVSVVMFNKEGVLDRQAALNVFSRLVKEIVNQDSPRTFNHERVIVVLLELAKNTFDHSNGDGFLTISLPVAGSPLQFTYEDSGDDFDMLTYAEFGVSSKLGNGVNFGMGLPLVRYSALGLGMTLDIARIDNKTVFNFVKNVT